MALELRLPGPFLVSVCIVGMMMLGFASPARAQIIQLPDCEKTPQHSFCVGLCRFSDPLPSWCPQPSPTPTRDPVVLIPGITVSQNKKLLYEDKEGGKWDFALGYNVYKGLINKLEKAGYTVGEDLQIAHYDWRKPASHSALAHLQPIIDQAKQNTGATKVDIVAHSFGGIVARAYIQGENYSSDVDQLITMGSPHQGSADAYVAWEGGIFPEGWFFPMRMRITNIENSLKKTHNQEDIQRPQSFRTFFPSLRDMLPLNDFVKRDGSVVPTSNLVEQNDFLKDLYATFTSITAKGVDSTTIAATNIQTMGAINITQDRTLEDRKLDRWRDGRANPLPPPLDSLEGDARVLLSNAHLGETNITLPGVEHHKIPDEAQNQVFEILGLEEGESFFSTFPKRIFEITILSPLDAVIQGPQGQILSQDQNDFGEDNAEYDDDLADPDDPKVITIADPPAGEYTITYTGTGTGEYTIITSYADEDETITSTRDGETAPDEVQVETITINSNSVSLIDDTDYKTLLDEISRLIKEQRRSLSLKGYEVSNITRPVIHAQNDLRSYERRLRQQREQAAEKDLKQYYESLNDLEAGIRKLGSAPARQDTVEALLQMLEKIRQHSPPR